MSIKLTVTFWKWGNGCVKERCKKRRERKRIFPFFFSGVWMDNGSEKWGFPLPHFLTSLCIQTAVVSANKSLFNCQGKKKRILFKQQEDELEASGWSKARQVVLAESNEDFVDVLLSFLTMPMGTIIRLLGKNSLLGCMTNSYECGKSWHQALADWGVQGYVASTLECSRRLLWESSG